LAYSIYRRICPHHPRPVGHRVFAGIGGVARLVLPRDRHRATENLRIAFPEAGRPLREAMVKAMFKTLGRNTFDFLNMAGASRADLEARVRRVDGMENFMKAHERGKGVIVITGHIGCWELMPAYFVSIGFPVTVVARRMKDRRVNDRLVEIRASVGVRTMDRDGHPREMMEVLRRGEILGVLIDQHTQVSGIYVPFFGRQAHTTTAIAKIALLKGAAILPMAIYLDHEGRHRINVLPMLEVPADGTKEQKVRSLTEQGSAAIESMIRTDPKQWIWFHNRWREPEAKEPEYAVRN